MGTRLAIAPHAPLIHPIARPRLPRNDCSAARQVVSICNVAERNKVSSEVISDHYVGSEAYWRHEQDILADVVRIMRERHRSGAGYPALAAMEIAGNPIYFPNVFITVAPAWWL